MLDDSYEHNMRRGAGGRVDPELAIGVTHRSPLHAIHRVPGRLQVRVRPRCSPSSPPLFVELAVERVVLVSIGWFVKKGLGWGEGFLGMRYPNA